MVPFAWQISQAHGMKTSIHVTPDDRAQLARLIGDRNTPAKVIWRARIVLMTAGGHSVKAIVRETGKSKPLHYHRPQYRYGYCPLLFVCGIP